MEIKNQAWEYIINHGGDPTHCILQSIINSGAAHSLITTQTQLAKLIRLSVKTVNTHLLWLQEHELIEIKRVDSKNSLYRISNIWRLLK